MVKISILSLSLLTIMANSAVSPALGEIALAFPEAGRLSVQMIVSLPGIVIVPVLFLTGFLLKQFSRKKILLMGLIIFTLGGTLGATANSILTLLFFRGMLGVGIGLIMPFSTALIADLYEGEERSRCMGLSSSCNMLGGMVSLVLAGYLAMISWRLSFLVYAFGIPVIAMIRLFLPENARDPVSAMSEVTWGERFPWSFWGIAIAMFFLNMVFFVLTPTMALFLKNNDLGDSRMAAFAIAIASLSGFFAGMFLNSVRKLTGIYFLPAMIALSATGFLIFRLSFSMTVVYIGALFIGFGNRSLYPFLFLKATEGISREVSVQALSIISAMVFLGQFMAPIFLRLIGIIFHDNSIRFSYMAISFSSLGVAFFLALFIMIERKRK